MWQYVAVLIVLILTIEVAVVGIATIITRCLSNEHCGAVMGWMYKALGIDMEIETLRACIA